MSSSKFTSWRKSRRSDGASNCVEVSFAADTTVGVRDSKNRTGPILEFSSSAWAAFTGGVRDDEFGPPSGGGVNAAGGATAKMVAAAVFSPTVVVTAGSDGAACGHVDNATGQRCTAGWATLAPARCRPPQGTVT